MFEFLCTLCKKEVKNGRKFTIESTEWVNESQGCGGGVEEEEVCVHCRNEIVRKIESMRK